MNTLFWAKASIVTGVIAAILNFYAAIRLGNIILFFASIAYALIAFRGYKKCNDSEDNEWYSQKQVSSYLKTSGHHASILNRGVHLFYNIEMHREKVLHLYCFVVLY